VPVALKDKFGVEMATPAFDTVVCRNINLLPAFNPYLPKEYLPSMRNHLPLSL
jgi:hypothetical protein